VVRRPSERDRIRQSCFVVCRKIVLRDSEGNLCCSFGLHQFRHFFLAKRFELRTDHAALAYLLKSAEPVGQQARFLDLMAEYDFYITHRSGTQQGNADALSRRPRDRNPEAEPCRQCKSFNDVESSLCRTARDCSRVKPRGNTAAEAASESSDFCTSVSTDGGSIAAEVSASTGSGVEVSGISKFRVDSEFCRR